MPAPVLASAPSVEDDIAAPAALGYIEHFHRVSIAADLVVYLYQKTPGYAILLCPYLTPSQGWPILPCMSMDDNDFRVPRALAEFGYPSAFRPVASLVAAANDLNPATRRTQQ